MTGAKAMDISKILCKELGLEEWQVNAVISLSDEGCTIPFIARYRKEAHGSLDDQKIHNLIERLEYLRSLDARREEIDKAITEQGKMTDEIKAALAAAETLAALEDIYRPFKPKRRTRATVAKEKGLEPLANTLMEQKLSVSALEEAAGYINDDKELFKGLHSHKDEVESAMGFALDWRELPERKASRILIEKAVQLDDRDKWNEQFDYIMDVCLKMKKA